MMVIADNTERDKQTRECRALVRFSPSRQAHPREGFGPDCAARYARRGADAWWRCVCEAGAENAGARPTDGIQTDDIQMDDISSVSFA
jgi:hypothetical protein